MLEALLFSAAACAVFEALIGIVSLVARLPPVKRRVDAYLARFPDDE